MLGLQDLYLQQTMLHGALPHDLGLLPYLMVVDVRNTLMSCCTTSSQAANAAAVGSLLPSFLQFDTTSPPESPQLLDGLGFHTLTDGAQPWELAFEAEAGTVLEDPGANMQ